MGTIRRYTILLAVLFLSSCSEEAVRKVSRKQAKPSIIHPLFFQEEVASQLNFPFWFNDSIIRDQGIEQINWILFSAVEHDPDQPVETNTSPRKKLVFRFNREGKLTGIQETEYSEGLAIATSRYELTPGNGLFSIVNQQLTKGNDNPENPDPYTLLKQLPVRKRVQQYDDRFADVRYHYFPLKKYRGSLSVDSIAHPGDQDWVIFGTPERPEKRYQVKNTVTEQHVTTYRYVQQNYPDVIEWGDYPFTQRRDFTYSKKGVFIGFIDSTFIDQAFITRTITAFSFDNQGRPVSILHHKGHASGETNYQTAEHIQYIPFSRD